MCACVPCTPTCMLRGTPVHAHSRGGAGLHQNSIKKVQVNVQDKVWADTHACMNTTHTVHRHARISLHPPSPALHRGCTRPAPAACPCPEARAAPPCRPPWAAAEVSSRAWAGARLRQNRQGYHRGEEVGAWRRGWNRPGGAGPCSCWWAGRQCRRPMQTHGG